MKSLVKVFSFVLVFAAAVALIDLTVQFVFHRNPDLLIHHGTGQIVFYLLFVLNIILFQKYINRESFLSLGLRPYPDWIPLLLKGWIAGMLAFVLYSTLAMIFGVVEFQMRWGLERILTAFIVAFSAFAIATTEEILFRGFFLQTLLKELPAWISVVITGIMFVLFHDLARVHYFWTEPKHMMLAGGLFSLNVLLCAAYLKTKKLFLPIGIHSGLVFAKVFFRKMKLVHVIEPNSYLFGIDGDARRGVLAWLFFLAGILVLNYLITERDRPKLNSSIK